MTRQWWLLIVILIGAGCEQKLLPPEDMSVSVNIDLATACVAPGKADCRLSCIHAAKFCEDLACKNSLACMALQTSPDCTATCESNLSAFDGGGPALLNIGCLQTATTCQDYLECLQMCAPLPQG